MDNKPKILYMLILCQKPSENLKIWHPLPYNHPCSQRQISQIQVDLLNKINFLQSQDARSSIGKRSTTKSGQRFTAS